MEITMNMGNTMNCAAIVMIRPDLVLLWTKTSDWNVLIDNYYKTICGQSEVIALPQGWFGNEVFWNGEEW